MAEVANIDPSGLVRRVRRAADLSQRQLAALAGVSPACIARIETDAASVRVDLFQTLLAAAGLRLAVLDGDGKEVAPMRADGLRNGAGSRFPAYLDPEPLARRTWSYRSRYTRPKPVVVCDQRARRDARRRLDGTPVNHPGPEALRLPRLIPRPDRPMPDPCRCGPECERHCVAACDCQCEPASPDRLAGVSPARPRPALRSGPY
jgi:HTH-type transcriptional regulator/antitoxin HipB